MRTTLSRERDFLSVINPLDKYIGAFTTSGVLESDVKTLLLQHGHEHTYQHVKAVAKTATELASRFGGSAAKSETAAWLHDISAIVPKQERIQVARALGLEVLPEEEQFPMIIHQKLSVPISRGVFGVNDPDVLAAVECHTTLRAKASLTEKIVFVADKIAWDQSGTPPYVSKLNAGLEHSIDAAALAYLDYLWQRRDELRVLHPWAIEARSDLVKTLD